MKIFVAGGTGFIGKPLVERFLKEKHQVIVLSRKVDAFKDVPDPNLRVEMWDGQTAGAWSRQIEDADAVINLSGEGIADKRWSREQKARLRSSRLDSTKAIVSAMAEHSKRPKVLVNGSAVGFYGSVPEGDVKESYPNGKGFLPELCAEWEAEAKKAEALGVRVVLLRTGVVIDLGGGALQKFILPFKLYAGGPLGSGKQWFPWVHRQDMIGAILHAVNNTSVSGPLNIAAPEAMTMAQFCTALGHAMKRPSWAPVPGFVLQILLGQMSEMILTGQKAVPQALLDTGYRFQYPNAQEALSQIFTKTS